MDSIEKNLVQRAAKILHILCFYFHYMVLLLNVSSFRLLVDYLQGDKGDMRRRILKLFF